MQGRTYGEFWEISRSVPKVSRALILTWNTYIIVDRGDLLDKLPMLLLGVAFLARGRCSAALFRIDF